MLILLDVYSAGETPITGADGKALSRSIRVRGQVDPVFVQNREDLATILAGIVILAINPTKQLGDTRNAERRSDVLTLLNAVYQYSIDRNGSLPSTINCVTAPRFSRWGMFPSGAGSAPPADAIHPIATRLKTVAVSVPE